MTTQQLLRRILPVTAGLIIILLLAFSCSLINNDPEVPALSNPNGVFAEQAGVSLSNVEVYTDLLDQYGVRVMNSLVTKALLTHGPINYIERAKNDPEFNVQEALEKAIYRVPLVTARQTLPAQELRRLEAQFDVVLRTNGFASQEAFQEELYFQRARELYVIDQLITTNQITGRAIADHYENNYYGEVCALVIRYDSLDGAIDAMLDVGLEVTESGSFVDVPFEQPLLEAYITLYNNAYNKNVSFVDGVFSGCEEDMIYDYETLATTNPSLANVLFKDLSGSFLIDENVGIFASFTAVRPIARGDQASFFLIQKISGDERNNFRDYFVDMDDLDYQAMLLEPASSIEDNVDFVNELINKVAQTRVDNEEEVQSRINQLLLTNNLTVFDPFLRLNIITGLFNLDENQGHPTIAFRYELNEERVNVTADEFFVELQRYTPNVIATLFNQRLSINQTAVYNEVVNAELRANATAQLQSFRDAFVRGEYEEFGFSPRQFTWPQFIYLAFNYRSELRLYNEIITQEVVSANFDRLIAQPRTLATYYDLMVERYNNYFSVDLIHLLIHRDDDNNGQLDPLLPDTWSIDQIELAETFAAELRLRINEIGEEQEVTLASLRTIATEYNNAFRSVDPEAQSNRWMPFKEAGFLLRVEDLGTVEAGMMVPPFEAEARRIYNVMVDGVLRTHLSETAVQSQFGVHVIYATNYTPKLNAYPTNPSLSIPSREDVALFEANDRGGLSSDVIAFLERYYVPVKDRYNESHRNVIFAEERAQLGTIRFTNDSLLASYNSFVEATVLQAAIQFDPESL
jgi:hypothetical protein